MSKKRITPEDDLNRLAENLWRLEGNRIQDRESFDNAYNDFVGGTPTPEQEKMRNKIFNIVRANHPTVRSSNLFKKAGGKDLRQDRKADAKRIVTTEKDYIKQGARNVDLKGYDTKIVTIFTYDGKQKGKNTKARRINNKRGSRFIDARGRFVSVKK